MTLVISPIDSMASVNVLSIINPAIKLTGPHILLKRTWLLTSHRSHNSDLLQPGCLRLVFFLSIHCHPDFSDEEEECLSLNTFDWQFVAGGKINKRVTITLHKHDKYSGEA